MKPEKSYLKPSILKQAIAVAMASDAPKKMGAILIKRNRIIAAATNDYSRTHPVQYWAAQNAALTWGDPNLAAKQFLHAEVNVLIKAKDDADTIVICRVGGHGGKELRNSFCCPICYQYITTKCPTIKTIHWSTNNQDFRYIKV